MRRRTLSRNSAASALAPPRWLALFVLSMRMTMLAEGAIGACLHIDGDETTDRWRRR